MFVLAFASVVAVGKLQLVAIKMHLEVCECILRPAFGLRKLQTLVEICFFHIFCVATLCKQL